MSDKMDNFVNTDKLLTNIVNALKENSNPEMEIASFGFGIDMQTQKYVSCYDIDPVCDMFTNFGSYDFSVLVRLCAETGIYMSSKLEDNIMYFNFDIDNDTLLVKRYHSQR